MGSGRIGFGALAFSFLNAQQQQPATNQILTDVADKSVNLFKPRHVEGDVIFHESVRIREEEKKLGYKPKVQYTGVRKWIGTSGVQ
jgi:hypothetical protein